MYTVTVEDNKTFLLIISNSIKYLKKFYIFDNE